MKKEQFDIKVLLKQNSEMSARLQWYRKQNKELKTKNQELNVWVQNLSQVFAGVASAWQTITNLEESLYALMKKRTDVKDKTVLSKYIAHFKTFADIIENLADKIKNTEHSKQVSLDAKNRLTSFVKNYEIFFKQFVDTYFKFNEQYSNWLNQVQKASDIQPHIRSVFAKNLENTQKIKEFQEYMKQSKDYFKIYESYSQHQLMDGIISKKQEEINLLKDNNQKQSRKFITMMDFNQQSVQKLLQNLDNQEFFQCSCGGVQIKYFKIIWEQALQKLVTQNNKVVENIQNNTHDGTNNNKINQQEFQQLNNQKNRLTQRNAMLLEKIEKIKLQNKLTQDMILKSNAYMILKEQCQQLMNYTNDLMSKLRKQSQYVQEIEKNRQQQLRQLRKRFQKGSSNINNIISNQQTSLIKNKAVQIFKSEVVVALHDLRAVYARLYQKQSKNEQILSKSRTNTILLKKQVQQMNKKWSDYYQNQINKVDKMEFRHKQFKQIQQKVTEILIKQHIKNELMDEWKQFISYVKSRDKKIKDLESSNRKKQKQLLQKEKMIQITFDQLSQTETVYLNTKQKLNKFQEVANKVERQIPALIEENYRLKTQFEQQKNIFNMRLKSQIDVRIKLQQKVKHYKKIEQQIEEVKKQQQKIQNNYSIWLNEQKQINSFLKLESNQKSLVITNIKQQLIEKDNMIGKSCLEKEKLKFEISQLKNRLNSISQKSNQDNLKIQMLYYRNKIMCSCTGDRQRQVVLKTCPHMFCKKCLQDSQINRNRKCPICGIKFTKSDVHQIIFN